METADAELVERALVHRDQRAFGELVFRHQGAIRMFLRRLTRGDLARADDLAQETFLEAWRCLAAYGGAAPFRTWLHGIAYNRFRGDLRRRRDEVAFDEELAPPAEGDAARSAALREDLGAALDRLSVGERAALELCAVQGHTQEEAAVILGSPVGTVKTNILRGKERLRVWLAAWNTP